MTDNYPQTEVTMTFNPIEIELVDVELIPYVRMTRRSMYVNKYAKRYVEQQNELRDGIGKILAGEGRESFDGMYIPDKTPFLLLLQVDTKLRLHRCDLDNLVKSALDLCQGIVYKNDSYCDAIITSRSTIPTDGTPKTTITFQPWSGNWQAIW